MLLYTDVYIFILPQIAFHRNIAKLQIEERLESSILHPLSLNAISVKESSPLKKLS